MVWFLIKNNYKLNGQYLDEDKNTPLIWAAWYGDTFLCDYLIQKYKIPIDQQDKYDNTALHNAIFKKHHSTALFLIDQGASINQQGQYGNSPLIFTAKHNQLSLCKRLLEIGAAVNQVNFFHNTALHMSAILDRPEICKLLIQHGANLNQRNLWLNTALHIAVKYGKFQICDILIKNQASMNMFNLFQQSPLHRAILAGNHQITQYLIDQGVNINCQGFNGNSPLHAAISRGDLEVPKILINSLANLSLKDKQKFTPLQIAKQDKQKLDVIYSLLEKNADINTINIQKQNILQTAISYRWSDELVYDLISRGVNVNNQDYKGDSALHQSIEQQRPMISELLIQKGADVNSLNKLKESPLHRAVKLQDLSTVTLLVQANAIIDQQDANGNSALHLAIDRGFKDVCEVLLSKKPKLDIKNQQQQTALHIAAKANQQDIFYSLLIELKSVENSQDIINYQDIDGNSPLHLAIIFEKYLYASILVQQNANKNLQNKNKDTSFHLAAQVDFLLFFDNLQIGDQSSLDLKNNSNDTPFSIALKKGQSRVLNSIVKQKGVPQQYFRQIYETNLNQPIQKSLDLYFQQLSQIDKEQPQKESLLLMATLQGNVNTIQILLQKQFDVNWQNMFGESLLHLAILGQNINLVQMLIDKKANLSIQDFQGYGPLHNASQVGFLDQLKLLVQSGSQVEIRNKQQNTPLHVACQFGHLEICKYLWEIQSSKNTINSYGDTALHVAAQFHHKDICIYLIQNGAEVLLKNQKNQTALDLIKDKQSYALLKDCCEMAELTLSDNDKILGTGAYGQVYQKVYRGQAVAVKSIFKSGDRLTQKCFQEEFSTLLEAQNQHVVKYVGIKQCRNQSLLVMELCDCNLAQYLKSNKPDLQKKLRILLQVAKGLNYLHSKNIIHRDIRPENILIQNGNAKISDFGLAKKLTEGQTQYNSSPKSPKIWQPPEILDLKLKDQNQRQISHRKKSDLFSYAILMCQVIMGLDYHPYSLQCGDDIVLNIVNDNKDLKKLQNESIEAVHIVTNLLQRSYQARSDIIEVLKCPLWWSDSEKCTFLVDVACVINNIKNLQLQGQIKAIINSYNSIDSQVFGSRQGWAQKLDEPFQSQIVKKNVKLYKENDLSDLLRFFRNQSMHIPNKNGSPTYQTQEEVFRYFQETFPELVISIYKACKENKDLAGYAPIQNVFKRLSEKVEFQY